MSAGDPLQLRLWLSALQTLPNPPKFYIFSCALRRFLYASTLVAGPRCEVAVAAPRQPFGPQEAEGSRSRSTVPMCGAGSGGRGPGFFGFWGIAAIFFGFFPRAFTDLRRICLGFSPKRPGAP